VSAYSQRHDDENEQERDEAVALLAVEPGAQTIAANQDDEGEGDQEKGDKRDGRLDLMIAQESEA
jgi:hypothetical protein